MGKAKYEDTLLKYLKKVDIPGWYKNMSPHQKSIITAFPAYVRDDYEQGSSYRTEKCLELLGLSPMINRRKINTMIQLSRGNELAFLFFILEGYYKNCNNGSDYNMNEQILMTTISVMDLLPTLRELDRILPPGPVEKKPPTKQKNDEPYEVAPHQKHKGDEFPYFQRQPRAKHISTNLTTHFKNFTVGFPFWEIGEAPNYGSTKNLPWFEEYELSPSRRTIKHIIDEAVDKFFLQREVDSKSGQDKQDKVHGNSVICDYHKFVRKEMELLKDQLKVVARDHCLEMIDVTLRQKVARRKKIVDQLEHDVDLYLEKYANMQEMGRTTTRMISKDSCWICKSLVATPVTKGKNMALIGESDKMAFTDVLQANIGKRLTGGGLRIDDVDFGESIDPCKATNDDPPDECLKLEEASASKNVSMTRIAFSLNCKPAKAEPDSMLKQISKTTKKSYFKPPTLNTPYTFKFKQVFKTNSKSMPQDNAKLLKKYLVSALEEQTESEHANTSKGSIIGIDSSILNICRYKTTASQGSSGDTSEYSKYSHVDNRAEIIDAVLRAAKLIWDKKVAIKTAEMEQEEVHVLEMKPTGPQVLEYKIDKFDPDDNELMNRLLKDGMRELRKNQRFVLASLPESHKLPVLREWIKRRYGKTYTTEELSRHLNDSYRIFELVSAMQNHAPKIDMLNMSETSEYFNNYEKFKKLANKVKEHNYRKLNTDYIQQVNACWHAMGNYLCPGGPPRKTFYAYMPSIPRDITRHHVWNGECRNYQQFRQDAIKRKTEDGG